MCRPFKNQWSCYSLLFHTNRFKGERYDLFRHNCNNFSHETAQFLTGGGIPQYILGKNKCCDRSVEVSLPILSGNYDRSTDQSTDRHGEVTLPIIKTLKELPRDVNGIIYYASVDPLDLGALVYF